MQARSFSLRSNQNPQVELRYRNVDLGILAESGHSSTTVMSFPSFVASLGTLLCCALNPSFGAAFAGLVGTFPQLVWLSENKAWLFVVGALLLLTSGLLQAHSRQLSCPPDKELAAACETARDWSKPIFLASIAIYVVGAFFAFAAPYLF